MQFLQIITRTDLIILVFKSELGGIELFRTSSAGETVMRRARFRTISL